MRSIRKVLGKKKICFPVIDEKNKALIPYAVKDLESDFTKGPYGVMQPDVEKTIKIDPEQIDVVIVPGLAFDGDRNRLGRGAGYYDRFLAGLHQKTTSIGVAFDLQYLPSLPPPQPYDRRVDIVVTETAVF